MPAGRPSSYKPEYTEQVLKLCRLGATIKDLAEFFHVSDTTIETWKEKHPEFLAALKEGKEQSDAAVADRLFSRAMGYSHPDVHISVHQGTVIKTEITKHYPPDTVACIFWLKNRQPAKWRDVQKIDHSGAIGGFQLTADKAADLIKRIKGEAPVEP